MFETSVVHAQPKPARGRFSLFTVSLIAHSAVILGVAAVSVASVDFPAMSPDEMANAPIFMPVTIPPPLGTPDGGGAPPKPEPVQKQDTPPPLPTQVTAPPMIPNDVPVNDGPPSTDATATGPDTGTGPGTNSGPIGVEWGTDGGIGPLDAPPAIVAAPQVEEKIYQPGGEVVAPVALRKVQPPYPTSLMRTRLRAMVIVRCIIDKNGNVRDPQIVKAAMPPFNDAVVDAVTQWKFKPGSYRGVAVETYLDLTVNFAVN